MTPENFCYWLQGYAEISRDPNVGELGFNIIVEHLGIVVYRTDDCKNCAAFVNWFDGYTSGMSKSELDESDWDEVKERLSWCFTKITSGARPKRKIESSREIIYC
jgi:hypothetical protein